MPFAVVCASHTPLMRNGEIDPAARRSVDTAFEGLAARIDRFAPELVIQFSPDHFNGFFYDLMPAFCLGVEASAIGDWDTHAGPLDVPAEEAAALGAALIDGGIDLAVSHRMVVDHGFTQVWEKMFGSARRVPIIPIFINSAAPPLPTFKRARLLGEAAGRFAGTLNRRVLFAASGGLSHDPPFPDLATAPPDVRARLIDGRNPTREQRAAREDRVQAAGAAAARGEGPCLPLDPDWDRRVMSLLRDGDLAAFDAVNTSEVRAIAGRGGPEVLTWVAAHAALAAAGPYETSFEFYLPVPGWVAGMGMTFGESRA